MDIFKTLNLDFKNLGFFQKVISLNILVFLIYIILRLFDFEYILINNFSLPNTEEISNLVLTLPLFPNMTLEEKEYLITSIDEFFEKTI